MVLLELTIVLAAIFIGARLGSIGIVTNLVPVIGYEKAAAVAKEALASGRSIADVALDLKYLTKEQLDKLLSPENMIRPTRAHL